MPMGFLEPKIFDVDRHQLRPGARASWTVLVRTGQGNVAIHQFLRNPCTNRAPKTREGLPGWAAPYFTRVR